MYLVVLYFYVYINDNSRIKKKGVIFRTETGLVNKMGKQWRKIHI